MVKAPVPANEASRIKDLKYFEILDSAPEDDYDQLVELVSQVCNCPIAIVNFIDSNRQWYKAAKNLSNKEADRENSFCGHVIMGNDLLVVSDATQDERFFDNPDVAGGLGVRFYAGAPIVSSNGYNLGTVCAIDQVPKRLTREQSTALKTVARQVSRLLDLRVKNKQLLETAKSLVAAQKKIAKMNMSEQESANYETAYLLHEEIAQAISAVKFYINAAGKDKSISEKYLDASMDELNNLTLSITSLAKKLTPTTFLQDDYKRHIETLVNSFEETERSEIEFNFEGKEDELKGNQGLMVYRIIQDLLRYCSLSDSPRCRLDIISKNKLSISLQLYPKKFMNENQLMMLKENIINRVEMMGGRFEKNLYEGGMTEFMISMPVL